MHIKCPCCGSVASLDLLLAAEDGAADVVKYAGELEPTTWRLMVQYLGLFRPTKTKLSWSRMASLLGELVPCIKQAEFSRGGQCFVAPRVAWEAALEQIISQRDRLTLPLRSHGYLLEIMVANDAKGIGKEPKPIKSDVVHTPISTHDPPPPTEAERAAKKAEAQEAYQRLMAMVKPKAQPPLTDAQLEEKRQEQLKALEEYKQNRSQQND